MIRITLTSIALAVMAQAATLDAQKEKPRRCVTLAKTWDAAVAEAKLLNVPIVVHSHGFYCPPCWGMHAAVMENKKYIKFAERYTVEVACVSRLQEGVKKEDRKAATYEAKGPDGQVANYLVHWPGMTVEAMAAISRSPAGRYNNTGKVPYTCIVDPHTLKELKHWKGGTSAKSIMEEVKTAHKALEKAHGRGVSRKDLARFEDVERELPALVERGDYARAIKALEKAAGSKPPAALAERVAASRERVVDAARQALDAIRAEADPAAAAKALKKLMRKLRGTGLDADAKALLEKLGAAQGR